MHRWSLLLSAYEYVSGTSNCCADCMSRLPLPGQPIDSAEKVHVLIQTEELPVTASQIAKESLKDQQLSAVMKSVQQGCWPVTSTINLTPLKIRCHELSIIDEYILWGTRVIIPRIFHSALLKELHCGHLGVSRMKSLARNHLWSPGIDTDIEKVCQNCLECCAIAKALSSAPAHPWLVLQHPWQRIHVDHAQFGKY